MQGVTYSISQLAQEFDVTTRTIRFYDQGCWSRSAMASVVSIPGATGCG
jgi:hypothetical protein